MSTELGITVTVGFVSTLMLAVAQLRRRFSIDPEVTRKLVHLGSGLMAMALPWIFGSWVPVAVACLISAAVVAQGLELPRAIAMLQTAEGTVRELDDALSLVRVLELRCRVEIRHGRLEEARTSLARARRVAPAGHALALAAVRRAESALEASASG